MAVSMRDIVLRSLRESAEGLDGAIVFAAQATAGATDEMIRDIWNPAMDRIAKLRSEFADAIAFVEKVGRP